jgi:hypothetical protein
MPPAETLAAIFCLQPHPAQPEIKKRFEKIKPV